MKHYPTREELEGFLRWYDENQPNWDIQVGRWYFGSYVWDINAKPYHSVSDVSEFQPSATEWWAIRLVADVWAKGYIDGFSQLQAQVERSRPMIYQFRPLAAPNRELLEDKNRLNNQTDGRSDDERD